MTDLISHKRQLLGIAKTWACKSLPGWDDTAHRDLIARHGAMALPGGPGHVSASSMNAMQLEAALGDYEARGWTRQRGIYRPQGAPTSERRSVPAHIAHLVRLWARLGQAGKVQNASRAALLRWLERQLGHSVPNLDVLTPAESQRAIEAMKQWGGR